MNGRERWIKIAVIVALVAAIVAAETGEIQAGFAVLSRVSDETLDSLLRLVGSLPEEELAETLEAIARTSPKTARRVMSAAARVARFSR